MCEFSMLLPMQLIALPAIPAIPNRSCSGEEREKKRHSVTHLAKTEGCGHRAPQRQLHSHHRCSVKTSLKCAGKWDVQAATRTSGSLPWSQQLLPLPGCKKFHAVLVDPPQGKRYCPRRMYCFDANICEMDGLAAPKIAARLQYILRYSL